MRLLLYRLLMVLERKTRGRLLHLAKRFGVAGAHVTGHDEAKK